MENPEKLFSTTSNLNTDSRTDIFRVSNRTNNNKTIPYQLDALYNYLDVLCGNKDSEEQPEAHKIALKAADRIVINGVPEWEKKNETLPNDPDLPWEPNIKEKFQKICDRYQNFPSSNLTNINADPKNFLYALNEYALIGARNFIFDAYRFKENITNLREILDYYDVSLVFQRTSGPDCELTFRKTGNIYEYVLTTKSKVCSIGARCYELNKDTNRLVEIKDISKYYKNVGETLCELEVIAAVDLTNIQKPIASFQVTIKSKYIKYDGPLGKNVPEIIRMETTKIKEMDLSIERQIIDFQRGTKKLRKMNLSIERKIIDFQRAAKKAGILIRKIIESNSKKTSQFSLIIQLFNLVVTDVLLQFNKLATDNTSNNSVDSSIFSEGLDLRFFSLNPSKLPISLQRTLEYILLQLDDNDIVKFNAIFQSDFVSEIENFNTMFPKSTKEEKEYLTAVNLVITQAINIIKDSLRAILKEKHNLKSKVNSKKVVKLKQTIDSLVPTNLFRTIDLKHLSIFLKNIKNDDRPLFVVKSNVLNLLGSSLRIGILIEKLLTSYSENPDQVALSIIFNLAVETKKLSENKAKLLEKVLKRKIGPATDEMIGIFYHLNNDQISKLLKIFNPASRSGEFLNRIKEAATSIAAEPTKNQSNITQLAEFFHLVIDTINTALKVVMTLKQLEILSFRKKEGSEKNLEGKERAHQILNDYLQANQHKVDINRLLWLIKFFKNEVISANQKEEFIFELQKNTLNIKNTNTEYEIIDSAIPEARLSIQCCEGLEWDKRMTLATFNPFITAVNSALALRFVFQQVLKLDPHQALTHYITEPIVVVTGLIGARLGNRKINHPNEPMNIFERSWQAIAGALILFEFTLGIGVNLYLYVHPKDRELSDEKFLTLLFPEPAILFALYSFWNSLSPTIKEQWFPQKSFTLNLIENFIDLTFKTLLYAGVASISSLVLFNVPAGNVVKGVAIPVGLSVPLALLDKTRFKRTANVILISLIAADFLTLLAVDWMDQLSAKHDHDKSKVPRISTYLQMTYWFSVLAFGLWDVGRNFLRFPRVYKEDPEFVIRKKIANLDLNDEERGRSLPTINPFPNVEYHSESDVENETQVPILNEKTLNELKLIIDNSRDSHLEKQPLLEQFKSGKELIFSKPIRESRNSYTTPQESEPPRSLWGWCNIV